MLVMIKNILGFLKVTRAFDLFEAAAMLILRLCITVVACVGLLHVAVVASYAWSWAFDWIIVRASFSVAGQAGCRFPTPQSTFPAIKHLYSPREAAYFCCIPCMASGDIGAIIMPL